MKKVLFLLSLLGFFVSLEAQSYKIDWGEEYEESMSKGYHGYNYLGIKDKHLFVFHTIATISGIIGDVTAEILIFDEEYKLKKKIPVDFKSIVEGRKYAIISSDLIKTPKKDFAYFILKDLDSPYHNRAVIGTIDASGLSDLKEVCGYRKRVKALGSNENSVLEKKEAIWKEDITTRVILSPDSTKMAYMNNTTVSRENKKATNMTFTVFDTEMEVLWEKQHDLSQEYAYSKVTQSLVSNTGEIYLLVRTINKEAKKKNKLPRFTFQVLRITESEVEKTEINLPNGLMVTRQIEIVLSKKEPSTLIVTGFYDDPQTSTSLDGVYLEKRELKTGAVKMTTTQKFDEKLLTELVDQNKVMKNNGGLRSSFSIYSLIDFKDGSIGFTAKRYYVQNIYTSSNADYISGEILVARFNVDGTFAYLTKIDRSLLSRERGLARGNGVILNKKESYTHYSALVQDDKVILVYQNDTNESERKEFNLSKTKATYLAIINKEGDISTQEIINPKNKEEAVSAKPGFCFLDENQIWIIGKTYEILSTTNHFYWGSINLDKN